MELERPLSEDTLKDVLLSEITRVPLPYPTRTLESNSGVFIRQSFSFLHSCTSSTTALGILWELWIPGTCF